MRLLRSVITKSTLALVGLLVGALLAEGTLRIATGSDFLAKPMKAFPWMALDPVLGWRNVPGRWPGGRDGTEVQINLLGFRGPEVSTAKPEGVVRIVCLGDSGTFGVNNRVAEERGWYAVRSYPDALSDRLQREGRDHVEIINAGVVGFSSGHVLRQLVTQILALDPDIITLRFGPNDAISASDPARRVREPDRAFQRTLLYRFHDWKLLRLGIEAWRRLAVHPEKGSVTWSEPEDYRRNLGRMITLARSRGIRILLLDYPLRQGPVGTAGQTIERNVRRRLARFRPHMREVARLYGVEILHSQREFANSQEPPFDSTDMVHPNEHGAELLGALLFERLDALGWFEPEATPSDS